jgi:hypothetical protein
MPAAATSRPSIGEVSAIGRPCIGDPSAKYRPSHNLIRRLGTECTRGRDRDQENRDRCRSSVLREVYRFQLEFSELWIKVCECDTKSVVDNETELSLLTVSPS